MSKALYPKISPYKQSWFRVDESHELYVEESGNPDGIVVLYLHGGPGGGSGENHRRYFDPEIYRIILFDQRGCGQSRPSPSLINNSVTELISDIEKIRQHLNIEQWLIAGGSWGTTLALLYGIEYPRTILGFILRGIFLSTQSELDWLYSKNGASGFYPEYYLEFLQPLTKEQQLKPLESYHKLLNSENEVAVISASKAWYLWELRLSTIEHHNIGMAQVEDAHQALCMAKLSSHYFINNSFIEEDYIIDNIDKIKNIPSIIIHGRFDMVCQLKNAHRLANKWDNAQLNILPQAGHSGFERQTIDAFCKAADTMATFLKEDK